ncbi:MAG: DNA-binding response regulator [Synergistaceae bacterium]|jgi:YesN/AraC family two-component response regulator|nr:DNA-binding response regulator [Synergistaceae bacterium]
MYRIVVSDDEYLEREFIKEVLRDLGDTEIVGECCTCSQAVDICSVMKPDAIFLNCCMGEMGGLEAAWRIRQTDRDAAIILTSGDEGCLRGRDDLKLHASSVVSEFLLKPIRAEQIISTVERCENRSRAAARISPRQKKRLRFYPSNIMSQEITRALSHIDYHFGENISLKSVAGAVSLSSYYFSRLFKKEVGVNFSQYILHKRLEEAKRMLGEPDSSITDISALVGFQEHNYFCRIFKKFTGITPSEYRKRLALQKEERENVKGKYL